MHMHPPPPHFWCERNHMKYLGEFGTKEENLVTTPKVLEDTKGLEDALGEGDGDREASPLHHHDKAGEQSQSVELSDNS